ncbi:MAG: hypothetical protein JJ900_01000 [Rhodospirillales bacterium]|nr:hypothetical protein [Rhodospirillales bacterium]MBO6785396.1 hypothetical protein [Rhodospirillales bacterium]
MEPMPWELVFAGVVAVSTAVNVVLFLKFYRQSIDLQKRMNWYTGSIESYARTELRLHAEQAGKEIVWWDPSYSGDGKKVWPQEFRHNADARVDKVFIGLPPHLRKNPEI